MLHGCGAITETLPGYGFALSLSLPSRSPGGCNGFRNPSYLGRPSVPLAMPDIPTGGGEIFNSAHYCESSGLGPTRH